MSKIISSPAEVLLADTIKRRRDPRITKAREEIVKAIEICNAVTQKIQKECEHKEVGESTLDTGTYFSLSNVPFRVCLKCGLYEDGVNTGGYRILHNELVFKLSRAEAAEFCLTKVER